MERKRGVCELLKASIHIVIHNFCQFLPSLLLLCYVMAVAVVPPSSNFLISLCILYSPTYNKDPAYQSNPNPNSSPNSIPDPNTSSNFSGIHFNLDACRVSILILYLVISLTGVFIERPAMVFGLVCSGIVTFLLLELMVGFVYTALTLRSIATFCPIVEESRARVQAMERWSFSLLRSWAWVVCGLAMALVFLDPALGFISLDSRIYSQVSTWSVACGSVGLPALLFLYIRYTQVALYLACKTYHEECKEGLITHIAQRSDDV